MLCYLSFLSKHLMVTYVNFSAHFSYSYHMSYTCTLIPVALQQRLRCVHLLHTPSHHPPSQWSSAHLHHHLGATYRAYLRILDSGLSYVLYVYIIAFMQHTELHVHMLPHDVILYVKFTDYHEVYTYIENMCRVFELHPRQPLKMTGWSKLCCVASPLY